MGDKHSKTSVLSSEFIKGFGVLEEYFMAPPYDIYTNNLSNIIKLKIDR